MSETISVSLKRRDRLRAGHDVPELAEAAVERPAPPPPRAAAARSRSGRSSPRHGPARRRPEAAPRAGTGRRERPAVSSLGCGDTEALLDLGDDALVGIEELVGHRVPATELLDREQVLRLLELVRALGALRRPGGSPSTRRSPAPRACTGTSRTPAALRARVLRDRDRVLDQDRLRRDHVVDVLAVPAAPRSPRSRRRSARRPCRR